MNIDIRTLIFIIGLAHLMQFFVFFQQFRAKNSDGITVWVKDTGIGIAKSTIDRLFHLDENVSTLGMQNEKGTGLGLIL
jgi:signal transduction histidine kinase